MLYRRARVPLVCLPPELASGRGSAVEPWLEVDILIEDGEVIRSVVPSDAVGGGGSVGEGVDLGGVLVFPGLLDCHTHLDKTHTWGRAPNARGEFWDAAYVLRADSVNWTEEDLYRRATLGLRQAYAQGTVALRTHLDLGGEVGPAGFSVISRLRAEWAGRVDLQSVSLCGLQAFADGEGAKIMEVTARNGASALGGFPQPNPDLPRQLDYLMAAARELGIGLDLHVDESGLIEAECLRATAEAVLRNEFPYAVACGHNCSLAVHDPARAASTLDLVKAAGIRLISLPLCNLYLQGRRSDALGPGRPGTPSWRGVTLIHEALERGVPVACASDNVRDAFYAWGDYNMLEIFSQSVRIAHMDTRMGDAVRLVSTAPADIMGLPNRGRVVPGALAPLVATDAPTLNTLIARSQGPRRLLRAGGVEVPVLPSLEELHG